VTLPNIYGGVPSNDFFKWTIIIWDKLVVISIASKFVESEETIPGQGRLMGREVGKQVQRIANSVTLDIAREEYRRKIQVLYSENRMEQLSLTKHPVSTEIVPSQCPAGISSTPPPASL
jgi:hypothetical protein